jgi:hypothetical protein
MSQFPYYKAIGGLTQRPYVIHPYYTGRDKGAISDPATTTGEPLLFFSQGEAWWYIFHTLQPNDVRAKSNYRVITLAEYNGD